MKVLAAFCGGAVLLMSAAAHPAAADDQPTPTTNVVAPLATSAELPGTLTIAPPRTWTVTSRANHDATAPLPPLQPGEQYRECSAGEFFDLGGNASYYWGMAQRACIMYNPTTHVFRLYAEIQLCQSAAGDAQCYGYNTNGPQVVRGRLHVQTRADGTNFLTSRYCDVDLVAINTGQLIACSYAITGAQGHRYAAWGFARMDFRRSDGTQFGLATDAIEISKTASIWY